jgi:hypothetical protein
MNPGTLPRPRPGVLDGWDSMTQAERDAAYNNTAAVAEVASLHAARAAASERVRAAAPSCWLPVGARATPDVGRCARTSFC